MLNQPGQCLVLGRMPMLPYPLEADWPALGAMDEKQEL